MEANLIYWLTYFDYFLFLLSAELALWDGLIIELQCQSVRLLYDVWPLTASMEVKNKYAYVTTQDICNKFIEIYFLWDVWFYGQIVCYNIRLPCLLF